MTPRLGADQAMPQAAGPPIFQKTLLDPPRAEVLLATAPPVHPAQLDPVQQEKINAFAADMRAGRWALNGIPVVIGASGRLIDGRHRLLAALESGAAFPTILVHGVPEDIVYQRRQRRSYAQVLEARGVAHAGAIEALLARLLHHHDDTLGSRHTGQSWSRMERVLRCNPEIVAIAAEEAPAGLGQAIHHMLLFMGDRCDPAALARLLGAFAEPALHGQGAPGALLRHALQQPRKDRSTNARAMRELAFAVMALNAAQHGGVSRRLAWSSGRPFPVLEHYPPLPGAAGQGAAAVPPARQSDAALAECSIEMAVVTPAMAGALIAHHAGLGPSQREHVLALARDMREGRWALDMQPVCLSEHGRLLNGQHRLLAIIEAGVAVELAIMRGLPEAASGTYEVQTGRTPPPAGILPGFGDAALLAAMANLVWQHESGPPGLPPGVPLGKAPAVALQAILAAHPRLVELRTFARRMMEYGTPSVLGYAAYVIEREDQALGAAFLARLDGSVTEAATHPISRLRRRLLAMRRASAGREAVLATVLECFRGLRARGGL